MSGQEFFFIQQQRTLGCSSYCRPLTRSSGIDPISVPSARKINRWGLTRSNYTSLTDFIETEKIPSINPIIKDLVQSAGISKRLGQIPLGLTMIVHGELE